MKRLDLLLLVALLSAPAPAAEDPACAGRFAKLASASKLAARIARVLLIRDVEPNEKEAERLALFWVKRAPGELTLPEELLNKVRRRLGKPDKKAPARNRYRFDYGDGAAYSVDAPLRWVSRQAVKKGWLKKEKGLGALSLLALTWPAYSVPFDLLHEKAEQAVNRNYLKYNFSFHDLKKEMEEHEKLVDEERKAHAALPTPANKRELTQRQKEEAELEEQERKYREQIPERIAEIINWHKQNAEIENRYVKFANPYQSPEESERLRKSRIRELLKNPLYADLAQEAGVDSELYSGAAQFPRLTELVENRELLFVRYSLVPMVIRGGKELQALVEKDAGLAGVAEDIQSSPVYAAAAKAFREKKIGAGDFQRLLMEDSFWELERFARWKALGQTPRRSEKTGKPIDMDFIRADMISDLNSGNAVTPP